MLFLLNGEDINNGNPLRPIVSINLKSSGYKLVTRDSNDGVRYELTKK